jgi:hypothetical protein
VLGSIAVAGALVVVGLLIGGFIIAGYAIWYLFIKK